MDVLDARGDVPGKAIFWSAFILVRYVQRSIDIEV
jgi:hypothetical protein